MACHKKSSDDENYVRRQAFGIEQVKFITIAIRIIDHVFDLP